MAKGKNAKKTYPLRYSHKNKSLQRILRNSRGRGKLRRVMSKPKAKEASMKKKKEKTK